jgi:hypothetical protein
MDIEDDGGPGLPPSEVPRATLRFRVFGECHSDIVNLLYKRLDDYGGFNHVVHAVDVSPFSANSWVAEVIAEVWDDE